MVDKSVIDWDYKSNKDEAPEKRLMYMLFYQMSRMCREKGAVKHDDRLTPLHKVSNTLLMHLVSQHNRRSLQDVMSGIRCLQSSWKTLNLPQTTSF